MLLRKHKLELVFLSETRLKVGKVNRMVNRLGFLSGLGVDCEEKSGGLMVLWKDVADVDIIKSYNKFHIDMDVAVDGGPQWRFTGFYWNLGRSLRHLSWELLR